MCLRWTVKARVEGKERAKKSQQSGIPWEWNRGWETGRWSDMKSFWQDRFTVWTSWQGGKAIKENKNPRTKGSCLSQLSCKRSQRTERKSSRCRGRQVDSQTCCLQFCFSPSLEDFGGSTLKCGGTNKSRTDRGQRCPPAHLHASVKKTASSSWWTAQRWDYRLCLPTSALSPHTCK